jgi:RNA polymerase sigma-70 factor (ECF subfamily)
VRRQQRVDTAEDPRLPGENSVEERRYPIPRGSLNISGDKRAMANGHDERLDAFAGWARQRMGESYRIAVAILRDEATAQDAVQDAVLRAWVAWPRLRDRSRLDPWLDRIIVNCCRDRLREQARRSRIIRALKVDGADPETDPRLDGLRDALAWLSPDQRVAVTLRYFHDLTVEEIARRTGTREGTVKSRLHYALDALRAAYGEADRGR